MKLKKLKRQQYLWAAIVLLLGILFIVFYAFYQEQVSNKNVTYNVNAAGTQVWGQFDGNEGKTGSYADPFITKSNITSLQKVWQVPVTSDGSPVYLSGVTTTQGVKNLVFITTKDGGITAFDDATGKQIWSVTTSGAAGITTSSPAIDPNNLYVYNYGKDGKVHKYNVGTGTEDTSGGWPLTATLIPDVEKGSSALAIGNGYLYVAISAYVGDAGDYVGHVVAKNLTSGTVTVFNSLCANTKTLLNGNCSDHQSGIWARPGVVMDTNSGNVFISSGNGPFAPPNNLGDSLVELSPDLTKIIDTYTPTNFQQLDDADADLGSSVAGIIPSLELGIQGGKDNKIRVINLKNLSGQGGPDHTGGELQSLSVNCNIFAHPISWVDGSGTVWVFVNDMCNDLYAYKVSNNRLTQVYSKAVGGSSPLIVNGMLFDQTSGSVRAIDPATGNVLWTGQVGSMHWQSPAVVNGHVFVIDNSNLTAFAVPNNTPPATLAPTEITPVFNCLANVCPSPSVSPTSGGGQISISPGAGSSPAPSGTVPSGQPGSTSPTVAPPCNATTSSASVSVKNRRRANGAISNLFQLLFQLLYLLFKLLLGGGTIGPIQLPSPCPSPTPISMPTTPVSQPASAVTAPVAQPTLTAMPTTAQTGTNTAVCPAVVDPAYFYPPSYWPQLLGSKAPPSVGFVFNPASGPGASVDQNLLNQVQQAKAKGMPMYAYVDTAYGKRATADVEADVSNYKKLYGLTSIMFDEMSSSASDLSYYQTLLNFVHSSAAGSKVIFNPGTYPDQAYMNLDAVFTVFEGPYSSFVNDSVPSYVGTTPAGKMSVIVYATSSNNLTSALQLAQQRNAGTVYITDNTNTSNPYDTLPAYWSTELNQIASNCSK